MEILYRSLLVVGGLCVIIYPVLVARITGLGNPDTFVDSGVLVPAFFLAGALAFWKRPSNPATQRLLAIGALLAISHALGSWLVILDGSSLDWLWLPNLLSQIAATLGFAAWIALFAVFPDGSYECPYEKIVARVAVLAAIALPLVSLLAGPTQELTVDLTTPVPYTRSPLWIPALAPLASAYQIIFLAPVAALVLFLLRYRRASSERRQRMRWVLVSALLVAAAFVTQPILGPLPTLVDDLLFVLAVSSLPITLVIGMLRHRLFDVDLLIRRSLVYGVLWIAIALTYAGLSALFGLAAGRRFSVPLAVIVTIAAAMLFQPARRSLERLADRLVYGERLTGYDLITGFGAVLESTFDLEELAPRVASTVHQGLDATWTRVSLYGTHDASIVRQASDGIGADERGRTVIVTPLAHRGEQIGIIECGPKREGGYIDADHDLLASLARQAALAIRNARLAADLADRLEDLRQQAQELATSRTRLVQAQESERRRIERDIHDGVQQEIVALMAKVEVTQALLRADPEQAERLLTEIHDVIRQTHVDLRELARGIHPAVLGDRGLEEAIVARAARLPIGVTIDVDPAIRGRRYASEIEGAAYFLISEGLTNVMKHAVVEQAAVHLHSINGTLHVVVADHGRGFDRDAVRQSGLGGLVDRLEALGGTLQVEAAPGQGSRLIGILPAWEAEHV